MYHSVLFHCYWMMQISLQYTFRSCYEHNFKCGLKKNKCVVTIQIKMKQVLYHTPPQNYDDVLRLAFTERFNCVCFGLKLGRALAIYG